MLNYFPHDSASLGVWMVEQGGAKQAKLSLAIHLAA